MSDQTIVHLRLFKRDKAIKDLTEASNHAFNAGHKQLAGKLKLLVKEMQSRRQDNANS